MLRLTRNELSQGRDNHSAFGLYRGARTRASSHRAHNSVNLVVSFRFRSSWQPPERAYEPGIDLEAESGSMQR